MNSDNNFQELAKLQSKLKVTITYDLIEDDYIMGDINIKSEDVNWSVLDRVSGHLCDEFKIHKSNIQWCLDHGKTFHSIFLYSKKNAADFRNTTVNLNLL